MSNEKPDVTYCDECDNRCENSAKKHPSQWQCIRFPNFNNAAFMARSYVDEPYMRCKGINGGKCPLFTPIREPDQVEGERVHRSDFEQ